MFFLLDKDNSVFGFFKRLNKKGQALVTDETLKWIIYIAVLVAAIFGVRHIVSRVFGQVY